MKKHKPTPMESKKIHNLTVALQESERARLKAVGDCMSAQAELSAERDAREAAERRLAEMENIMKPVPAMPDPTLPVRRRLPDTRNAVTHKFSIAGHEGYIIVGMFDDGQPGELFVHVQKAGSMLGGLMDTVGILTSMALQYNVPIADIVRKLAYVRFEPSGLTDNPDIRFATSVTDYVFRWIATTWIPGFKEATSTYAS